MSLLNKKSTIHNHLARPTFKKTSHTRDKDAENNPAKLEQGLGKLQMGTEELSVQAAYKPIFRF